MSWERGFRMSDSQSNPKETAALLGQKVDFILEHGSQNHREIIEGIVEFLYKVSLKNSLRPPEPFRADRETCNRKGGAS